MNSNQLPSFYQQFIHLSRYSRWQNDKGRRETWGETVDRLISFFTEHIQENYNVKLDLKTRAGLEEEILSLGVMPSMRAMMTAGPALKRDNIAGYNWCWLFC
jgi:ribonucleoside-triphosphate reductase